MAEAQGTEERLSGLKGSVKRSLKTLVGGAGKALFPPEKPPEEITIESLFSRPEDYMVNPIRITISPGCLQEIPGGKSYVVSTGSHEEVYHGNAYLLHAIPNNLKSRFIRLMGKEDELNKIFADLAKDPKAAGEQYKIVGKVVDGREFEVDGEKVRECVLKVSGIKPANPSRQLVA